MSQKNSRELHTSNFFFNFSALLFSLSCSLFENFLVSIDVPAFCAASFSAILALVGKFFLLSSLHFLMSSSVSSLIAPFHQAHTICRK